MNTIELFLIVFTATLCAQILTPFLTQKIRAFIEVKRAKSATAQFYKTK